MRNAFEDNSRPKDEDIPDGTRLILPTLSEGRYELVTLASGRIALVVVTEDVSPQQDEMDVPYGRPPKKTCGCGKYQGCDVCRNYQRRS